MAKQNVTAAFTPAVLPRRLEKKLAMVDWSHKDVLVGGLRSAKQLKICKKHRFYHVPATAIPPEATQVKYIAIYQSGRLFGKRSGVRWYGEVARCSTVCRREIYQLPKDSDELYYLFRIKRWKRLRKPIRAAVPIFHLSTNLFLLKHSSRTSELTLGSSQEFRLYRALQAALERLETGHREAGFRFGDRLVLLRGGTVQVWQDQHLLCSCATDDFYTAPLDAFGYLLPYIL